MHAEQNNKFVRVLSPAAIIDNASGTTTVIDTMGYDYCTIVVQLGAMDIAMTALKVQEADAITNSTTLTSGADVTGLVWGTSANHVGTTSTLPIGTDDDTFFVFEIDCRARKRYLDVTATFGDGAAGTYCSIMGILSRGNNQLTTAAGRGCTEILRL
jgi:hypothetical protein